MISYFAGGVRLSQLYKSLSKKLRPRPVAGRVLRAALRSVSFFASRETKQILRFAQDDISF
jgi:hypothetical protein